MRTKAKRRLRFAVLVLAAAAAVVAFAALRGGAAVDAAAAGRFALRRLAAGETSDARRLADLALAANPDQPDACFVRATLRAARGDRAGALADLEACARGDPADFVVCLQAGVVARTARPEAARRWFEEASRRAQAALDRDAGDVRARVVLAAADVALGRLGDAVRRLDEIDATSPSVAADATALRALVLVARGDEAAARSLLRAAADGGSRPLAALLAELDSAPESLVRAGLDAVRRGDAGVARAYLRRATRLSPDDLAPASLLAATYGGGAAARDVEEESRRLADADPRGALRPFFTAGVLFAGGDADGAAVLYRRALDRAPQDPSALRGAVVAELARGRGEEARALCGRRLGRDDATGGVDLLLGAAFESEGDDAGAETAYRAALRKNPAAWEASDRLAELLLRHGDVAGAAETCDAALAVDPTCLPLRIRRADVRVAAGEPARAAEELAVVAETHPCHAAVLLHRARALAAAGDRVGAAQEFAACARADPACVEARIALVEDAARSGRLDELVAELNAQTTLRPRDPVPRFALGVAAETAGDLALADRHYRAALAAAPRFGVAANNLAWLLAVRLGRPREARPFAETAARLLPRNPRVLDTRGWVRFLDGDVALAEPDLARAAAALPLRADVAERHARVIEALADERR